MDVRRLFCDESCDNHLVLKRVSEKSVVVLIYKNSLYFAVVTAPWEYVKQGSTVYDKDIWRAGSAWQWSSVRENDSLRYVDVTVKGCVGTVSSTYAGFAGRARVLVLPAQCYTWVGDKIVFSVSGDAILSRIKNVAKKRYSTTSKRFTKSVEAVSSYNVDNVVRDVVRSFNETDACMKRMVETMERTRFSFQTNVSH